MNDIPFDLVLLAQVLDCRHTDEFTEHPGNVLERVIEREFAAGRLSVYGKAGSSTSTQRVRVQPIDCEINWMGPPGTNGYRPCAEPMFDQTDPATILKIKAADRFYDLAIARDDWERLLDEVMAYLGFVMVAAAALPLVDSPQVRIGTGAPGPAAATAPDTVEKRRKEFWGHMAAHMGRKGLVLLERMNPKDIARDYIDYHEQQRRDGKKVPPLPHKSNRVARVATAAGKIRQSMRDEEAKKQSSIGRNNVV